MGKTTQELQACISQLETEIRATLTAVPAYALTPGRELEAANQIAACAFQLKNLYVQRRHLVELGGGQKEATGEAATSTDGR